MTQAETDRFRFCFFSVPLGNNQNCLRKQGPELPLSLGSLGFRNASSCFEPEALEQTGSLSAVSNMDLHF